MLWANGKSEFFRVESKTSILRWEWIISARASCTRKLLRLFCKEKLCKKTLYSGIELICESPKQCLIITKPFFFDSFLLFLFVWRVCKSFWKESLICIVQRVHFQIRIGFFQLSTNLDKDFFRCPLCRDAATIFTNAKRLPTSFVCL